MCKYDVLLSFVDSRNLRDLNRRLEKYEKTRSIAVKRRENACELEAPVAGDPDAVFFKLYAISIDSIIQHNNASI